MSYRINYDIETNALTFQIFEGLDRTQEQMANEPITFSTEFKNLDNPTMLLDESSYKTHALVITADGYENIIVTIDEDADPKRWITIDASSVEYIDTDDNYYADVKSYAIGVLQDTYANKTSVSGDTITEGYTYLVDYSCGDKCNIILSEIGVTVEARIIEVNEVFKDNQHTIELQFGDKIIE